MRGTKRPRSFRDTDNEADVVDRALSDAESALRTDEIPDWSRVEKALIPLVDLHYIGPATASAVLSIQSRHVPFMSDESLLFCLGFKKYDAKTYKLLYQSITKIVSHLNKDLVKDAVGKDEIEWDASKVERAIFAWKITTSTRKDESQSNKRVKLEENEDPIEIGEPFDLIMPVD